jgi:hypothetical protein
MYMALEELHEIIVEIVNYYGGPSYSLDSGGHSLMKFKTKCVQTLLPLCYMLRIIQNFIIFFVKL